MNQDTRDSLAHGVERLIDIYNDLTSANLGFIEGIPDAGHLTPLLDQREVSFAELRDLEEDLVTTLRDALPHEMVKGLAEVLPIIERELPENQETGSRLRTALKKLVDSDREVHSILEKSKELIETQIKKIRRGANLLKGYLQPDETGSCFIDKVK